MNPELERLYHKEIIHYSEADTANSIFAGCCTQCEKKGCIERSIDSNLPVYIGSGLTSDDVVKYLNDGEFDTTLWHQEPVLFLMREPSSTMRSSQNCNHDGIVKEVVTTDFAFKTPLLNRYWSKFEYRSVGELFAAVVNTFQLANASISYLRKCKYPQTRSNNSSSITDWHWMKSGQICFEKFFERELNLLRPKVVFCIELDAKNDLLTLLALRNITSTFGVVMLPKPSFNRLLGFRQEYYKYALFGLITEGLLNAGVIDSEFAKNGFENLMKNDLSIEYS